MNYPEFVTEAMRIMLCGLLRDVVLERGNERVVDGTFVLFKNGQALYAGRARNLKTAIRRLRDRFDFDAVGTFYSGGDWRDTLLDVIRLFQPLGNYSNPVHVRVMDGARAKNPFNVFARLALWPVNQNALDELRRSKA